MCSAACARIKSRNGDNAYGTRKFYFATVLHCFALFGVRKAFLNRAVFADNFIGALFGIKYLLVSQRAVKVDGDKTFAHVESDIFVPIGLGEDTGKNMLAGMPLHIIAAVYPIQYSVNLCAGGKFRVGNMNNALSYKLGIRNINRSILLAFDKKISLIAGLSAPFGIKCRIRQFYLIPSLGF